jgi:hypothetical protein
LGSLNREEDDSEEGKQNFFTGGEKSYVHDLVSYIVASQYRVLVKVCQKLPGAF